MNRWLGLLVSLTLCVCAEAAYTPSTRPDSTPATQPDDKFPTPAELMAKIKAAARQ